MNPSEPLPAEWLGRISFEDALALQEVELSAVRAGTSPGRLFLLEHDPVFTIGRTRDQSSLLLRERLPAPLHEINRGDFGDGIELVLDSDLSWDLRRCYRFINRHAQHVLERKRDLRRLTEWRKRAGNDSPLP